MDLAKIIPWIQIIISALLIVCILLQQRGAGSSAITGGTGGASYYTKRGMEKFLFITLIILSTLFIVLGIVSIMITR